MLDVKKLFPCLDCFYGTQVTRENMGELANKVGGKMQGHFIIIENIDGFGTMEKAEVGDWIIRDRHNNYNIESNSDISTYYTII